ncbi:hypothetical protein OPT61_g10192 [Boeremia exigua]|uniref:Uncharacterized protein n=1 Tax=Boeremia exigua TaxID=749465 RepID=A0ACC2HQX9_9PLEO|nr:hypothetical protein OPT61_g10192 [Boeremia exigua]
MASRPPTPPQKLPTTFEEWRLKRNNAPCEWGERYRPGGLHPIDLGDTFCDGKYKVIRKLGAGSYSTVWLVVSESVPKYVAIKVMDAASSVATSELAISGHLSTVAKENPDSRHVTELLDHFKHKGPNGIHQCLVFEVMGSTATSLVEELPENKPMKPDVPQRYPKWMAKTLLLHTLRGLAYVHQRGIVHADVQPGNLLFSAKDIMTLEPQQLEQHTDRTVRPLHRIDGKIDHWAPRNLYEAPPLYEHVELGHDLCVKLSDFGAAFFVTNPPADTVTPLALRAPELVLKQPFDAGIDIWCFGCLMFEFLTGEMLLSVMKFGNDQKAQDEADDELLCQMNDTIRPLPDSLMRVWPRASKWFDADHNHLQPDDGGDVDDKENAAAECESKVEKEKAEPFVYPTLEQQFAEAKHPDIGDDEAAVICQIIQKILAYDPAERPTAAELLEHPWFSE